jgi:mycoredoxin
MTETNITVYGTDWCGDCFRTRQFLKRHSIPFTFINIDRDKTAEEFVLKTNRGMRSVPTIVFEDGAIVTEPSNHELASILGIEE